MDELRSGGLETWQHIFDALVESVLILNKDKEVVEANRAAYALLPSTYTEIIGHKCYELFACLECQDCPLEHVRNKGDSYSLDMERSLLGKYLRVTCAPLFKNDVLVGYIHSALDITQQRNLKNQLVQARKMDAISTLAGGIAHDFNNILGVILGNADLLQYRLSGDAGQMGVMAPELEKVDIQEHLLAIQKAGQRAEDLVNQILTFSRQTSTSRRDVIITPIIKETVKFLKSTVPATIELRAEIAEDVGYIYADPTQIHQALMNLCTNAVEAIGDQHGVIEITVKEKKVTSAGAETLSQHLQNGEYIVLSVKDTGVGMSEEVLERIYDPFFTTGDGGVDSGLGLAVLHGIATQHNATIDVHSEPGKGAEFAIYFPKVNTFKEKGTNNAVATMLKGSETLIFADDEEELVKMFSEMLEYLGYTVLPAASGQEVLAHIKNKLHKIDMVITDQTMPHMTGLELARAIKKLQANLPVILCSGYAEPVTEESARKEGINAFLAKPIDMKDLAVTIRQVFLLNSTQ
ncbi:MAG: hybrid sensor histidine kinase/response regulator [Desulfobulbus sp.]|nr:MAG: hybrid sensor histidine kinase/response regulator [Desulfobulbus sp.]